MSSYTQGSESPESNLRALSIFAIYLTTNIGLTVLITQSLVKAYDRLSISRQSGVRYSLFKFTALAIASLGVTWYYMLSFFTLSYRSWAISHNVPPSSSGDWWFNAVQLGPWLKDVQLFRDAWETVVETPARTCWSLPIFFVTAIWSFFIAKEAQRRQVRHGWAYMVLGQLVAISFAMNLFYLAVLVHPDVTSSTEPAETVKLKGSGGVKIRKARTDLLWTPPANFYLVFIPLTFYGIHSTTLVAGNKHFLLFLAVPHVLLLVPPILNQLMPRQLGVLHGTEGAYNQFYQKRFANIAWGGVGFYVMWVYTALTSELHGDRHTHRHSNAYEYPWWEDVAGSGETNMQNLLRSLFDHPAVSSVGWDSILCMTSFLCWKLASS